MAKKQTPIIGILSMEVRDDKTNIYAEGKCLIKFLGSKEVIDTDKISIDVPVSEKAGEIHFEEKYGKVVPGGFRLNKFKITFNKEQVKQFDIQNKIIVNYKDKYLGRFLFSMLDWKKGKNKNSKVFIDDKVAIYFRQNRYNSLVLTVRDVNQYDYPAGQERIKKAFENSKQLRNQDIVLMYEKNCSRYEESASVLYEKMIDAGYKNVYYVVNFDNPAIQKIDQKYRANLIEKDSDKHLEYFFASNKFISTESTEHALQLRIASKLAMDKINSKDLQYVFLQHGVMYMVSLNSELRTGFRSSTLKLHKTVVSSEAEAKHFIELAGMKADDLYITGLAKFDRCYRHENADKIIIMLTWRRWETNQARIDIEKTKYYQMIERIYNAVPDYLKEKVIILPHPLMAERFRGKTGLGSHILMADSYDEVFRDCNLLITDYSSIAYDAFYRGANVIFCWEELEECMKHYGEGSFLMLNENNAFGDICMNEKEISQAVADKYKQAQSQEYINKFKKIVEFDDGKNSERIIEKLKQDGMI